MSSEILECLASMEEHINDAIGFVAGMDESAFYGDKRTVNAVVTSLTQIGEASGRIVNKHPEFAKQNPSVPWGNMRGMRNQVTHEYGKIDRGVLWSTVNQALPLLLQMMPALKEAAVAFGNINSSPNPGT